MDIQTDEEAQVRPDLKQSYSGGFNLISLCLFKQKTPNAQAIGYITVIHIMLRSDSYLKHDVSETRFSLRLQVEISLTIVPI
jgi:hypothetical protein